MKTRVVFEFGAQWIHHSKGLSVEIWKTGLPGLCWQLFHMKNSQVPFRPDCVVVDDFGELAPTSITGRDHPTYRN